MTEAVTSERGADARGLGGEGDGRSGRKVMVPGSARIDGRPNDGTQESHSRLATAASTRRNGGPYGGSTPIARRTKRFGMGVRLRRKPMGARHPEARKRLDVHDGVSLRMVVSSSCVRQNRRE